MPKPSSMQWKCNCSSGKEGMMEYPQFAK